MSNTQKAEAILADLSSTKFMASVEVEKAKAYALLALAETLGSKAEEKPKLAQNVYALKRKLAGKDVWETVSIFETEESANRELELLQRTPMGVQWTVEPHLLHKG